MTNRRGHTAAHIAQLCDEAGAEHKSRPKTRRALAVLGAAVAAQGVSAPASWVDDFDKLMAHGLTRKGTAH